MALIVCFTGTEVKGYFRHFGSEILDFNRTGCSDELRLWFRGPSSIIFSRHWVFFADSYPSGV
ncbi:hypothetical protein SDJN02_05301, partial [Cucurbita argyrosperma subsp. argyrosperma]